MIRRWFLDPSDATLDWQGEVLSWLLVAVTVRQIWPFLWPVWLPVMLAFGG